MQNPQQNININISYNLGADKPPKVLPAKKINKNTKTQVNPNPNNCDIEIKLNRKNCENNLRKSNQYKSVHENKKSKKSKNHPLRNTMTPDVFIDRRIKTQGPSTDYELLSAFKKDKTFQKHLKSTQVPAGKSSHSNKKHHTQPKMHKIKTGHVTSCTVPNWKKIPISVEQHTISQVLPPKKKRTQSQGSFIKNDKVVSKLLNMSLLGSQLGGSQPITSERKGCPSSNSKNMKEYMSSMDMRIIRCMQEDVPVFADKKSNGEMGIVRSILLNKEISFEELERNVTKIQRVWRRYQKRNKSKVKQYKKMYKNMFQQITSKLKKEKLVDLSDIAHSPDNLDDENPSLIFENQNLVDSIKRQRIIIPGTSSDGDSFENTHSINLISQDQEPIDFNDTHQLNLNFSKYRQLMKNQQEKKGKKPTTKEKCKQEYNSVNKILGEGMNSKNNLDTQLINDYLFKQSQNNVEWMENQFQEEKHSSSLGQVYIQNSREKKEQNFQGLQQFEHVFQLPKDKEKQERSYQDSLEEEEDNQYDHNKYETTSDRPIQSLTPSQPFQLRPQNEPIPIQLDRQPAQTQGAGGPMWISQHLMEGDVVRSYLDQDLNAFGMNFNERIINNPRFPQIPQLSHQQDLSDQNVENDSDQPIGGRFQQSNFGVLQPESEPEVQKIFEDEKIDQIIQDTVGFLISQFASDISVILKKSTGQVSGDKKPQVRLQGISTNLNAISEYLSKFIQFIQSSSLGQPNSVQKVVDTINKDIGPSSLQILTYLRPESEESILPMQASDPSIDEDDGLFVVPAQIYQDFEQHLEEQYKKENQKEMGARMKAYYSFWHRCIFESYNQCLDYERPYGVEGKPYEWTTENKIFRKIKEDKIGVHLHKAEQRLLDLTSMVGGIIFQKADSPFSLAELSQEQKHMMNEQRLSRILATELLESEQSWINYNDEMAELLVELSRMLEEKLFFEYGTELKKLQRRRKMLVEESIIEESVAFNIQEL